MKKTLLIISFSGIVLLTGCAEESVALEEHEALAEENEDLNGQVLELEELLEEKETELKNARADVKKNTNEEQIEDKQQEEKEEKETAEQGEEDKAAEKKEQEEIESLEEAEKEDDVEGEMSASDLETEIENILEDARPMNASVSQGLDGNFVTLEGRAKDGFSNSQIGRNIKEDMAKILVTFKENDIDFEEIRISFNLPTVNAYGEEGESNMALGVFDKETVERLEVENEHYIAQSIDSIALQFSMDSQFID